MKGFLGIARGMLPCTRHLPSQACLTDAFARRYAGYGMLIGLSRLLVLTCYRENISQGGIDSSRDLPLFLLLRVSRRTNFKECGCSLKSCNGFSIRIDVHSDLASAPVIRDSLPWKTRTLIVGSNLSTDGVQVFRVHLLERLCDTTMKEVPVRGTQGIIGLLSEFIRAKVIGSSRVSALFSCTPPLPPYIRPS